MTPPTVQYNTYMQPISNYYIDTMSKVYIICELILGLNRLPVFGNVKFIFVLLAMVWSVLVQIVVILVFLTGNKLAPINIMFAGNISQFVFITMFSLISWKRMYLYYSELNKFDTEVGYRPFVPKGSINNFIFIILILVSFLILFFLRYEFRSFSKNANTMLLMYAVNVFEVHYFGHLLNLLTPRLRLINYFMELSLSNIKDSTGLDIKEFTMFKKVENKSNCEMKKLMNLYHTIIKAYDFLIEAIKWQLLFIIAVSFTSILGLSYHCFHRVILNQSVVQIFIADFGVSVLILLPLFSPCVFGDRIHNEVRRLRELLASRLYENNFDKSCRSIARALLAFTETRDLSFSLLRMLRINISLPFKFVGLVVTYLIILLQFEKVLNT